MCMVSSRIPNNEMDEKEDERENCRQQDHNKNNCLNMSSSSIFPQDNYYCLSILFII